MGSIKEIRLDHFHTSPDSRPEVTSTNQLAVSVRNAYKTYSKKKESNHILNNFTMSVEEGHIYSLLGSSGCGKTTLLSCIVGLRKLDSGDILVSGKTPGTKGSGIPGRKVGYMPQEIALYAEFSIAEVLQYFGRLYGIPKWEINDRTQFLITFLNLPPASRRIMTLSGGQQRRVSFAVALVHNPELLILDEPTVGVDPLLRQSIWTHLVKLASTTKTTIIITTHFIEEARESNMVGLMRNGRLLAEDSPMALMDKYNTYILEDIVIQICLRDDAGDKEASSKSKTHTPSVHSILSNGSVTATRFEVEGPDLHSIPDDEIERRDPFPFSERPNLGQMLRKESDTNIVAEKHSFAIQAKEKVERIYALLTKNVLVLVRNLIFVLFIVGVPALQVVLVCVAIGSDPHGIKIGVVNNEIDADTSCADMLKKAGCIMSSSEKYNSRASCQFINALNTQIFTLVPYKKEEDAMDDIRKTNIWGLMSFPVNFTENLKDRVLFGVYADEGSLARSRITFHLDLSNKQIGLQIQKNFYSTLKDFMYDMARACKVDTSGLDTPLFFDSPIFGSDDTNFTDFIAPGVLLAILFFFPLCSTGVSMITEKKSGALERTMVAGVTDLEIMISHFLTQFVLLVLQAILSFGIMISVFQIRVYGSLFLAVQMGVLIGISGISFGFFMASICKDELEAVMLSMGTFFPNFILSGVIWPIEGMPFYLQQVSYLLPCTLAGESLRSIIGRGVPFTHSSVWPGFLSTALYICFYWILTLVIFRLKNKK